MSAEEIMTVALVIQTTVLAINTITLMVIGIMTLKVVSGHVKKN